MSPDLPLGVVAVVLFLIALPLALRGSSRQPMQPSDVNVPAMLAAIAAVETGNNPQAVGAAGERSAWQITPASWRMHTRHAFALASTQPAIARMVAERHLAWTLEVLSSRVAALSPERIAAAWRWGPAAEARFARSDYARRVANLYREHCAQEEAQ